MSIRYEDAGSSNVNVLTPHPLPASSVAITNEPSTQCRKDAVHKTSEFGPPVYTTDALGHLLILSLLTLPVSRAAASFTGQLIHSSRGYLRRVSFRHRDLMMTFGPALCATTGPSS